MGIGVLLVEWSGCFEDSLLLLGMIHVCGVGFPVLGTARGEYMCPAIWLIPIRGLLRSLASDFAYWMPISRAMARPGPWVTAMASILSSVIRARLRASW